MRRHLTWLTLGLVICSAWTAAQTTSDAAADAARRFGQALTQQDGSDLREVLPDRGKVHMRLVRLGPEQGAYSSGQVVALFRDFLRTGEVRSFEIKRVDDREGYALVHARSVVYDREGRSSEVDLHLTLEPEASRWVVREIRETSP